MQPASFSPTPKLEADRGGLTSWRRTSGLKVTGNRCPQRVQRCYSGAAVPSLRLARLRVRGVATASGAGCCDTWHEAGIDG